jgi:hypothetical protein
MTDQLAGDVETTVGAVPILETPNDDCTTASIIGKPEIPIEMMIAE